MRRPDRCDRGRDAQRGAVLAEVAITAPLVLFLVFGIIEMGLMLRDHVTLNAVGHDAARAAAIGGNDLGADHHVLEVILDSASALPDDALTRVVVFRADGPADTVPPACLVNSQDTVTDRCNLYTAADLARPISDFGCDPLTAPDRWWCPTDRVVARTAANGGPPDYVGVYLELDRSLITGLYGGSQTLTVTKVARLEPRDL